VYRIIKGYDDTLGEPAAIMTTTDKAALKSWMNCHGVARSTILLGMEPSIEAEYMVIDDVKTLWEKLASAYHSMFKLNIFEIREDLWSMTLQDCGDVDNYPSQIVGKIQYYNICAEPPASSTADTDANMATAQKLPRQVSRNTSSTSFMGVQETLCGNSSWSA